MRATPARHSEPGGHLPRRRRKMGEAAEPEHRWLERGEGEPVLLLHGLLGRMDHWDAVLDRLAPFCRAMAPSLPIFEPSLPDATIRALRDHVLRFLDALGIPRAIVGGNSLGGHCALELALSHPDRVAGLVLTGSSGLFERAAPRSAPRSAPRRLDAAYVRGKMEEVFWDSSLVTDQWVDGVHALLTTRPHALRVLSFARDTRRRNVARRLGSIRVPTLLIWGAQDRITPPGVGARFHALIPTSEMRYLARCGHAPMLERPGPFADILAAWLVRTRARRRASAPEPGVLR